MTRRDPILPLILSALLAILFHLLTLSTLPRLVAFISTDASITATPSQLQSPASTKQRTAASNSLDRHSLPSSPLLNQPEAPPKKLAQEQPKPQLRPGSDRGKPVFTVAWIPHEDPRALVAPPSATEQPALQNKFTPAPDAPLLADPDEPQPIPADAPPRETKSEIRNPKSFTLNPSPPITSFPTPDSGHETLDNSSVRQPLATPSPPPPIPPETSFDQTPPQADSRVDATNKPPIKANDLINDHSLSIQSNPPPQTFSIAPTITPKPTPPNPFPPFSLQPPTNPKQSNTTLTPQLKQSTPDPATQTNQFQHSPSPTAPILSSLKSEIHNPKSITSNPSPPTTDHRPLTTSSSSPRSDRQSQPFALNSSNLKVQPGAVLTGRGIEIKTVLPRLSVVARYLIPHNPVAIITFDRTGQVRQAKLIKSTGYENWDGPILASLYQWRASGKLLQEINDSYELQIQLVLINE